MRTDSFDFYASRSFITVTLVEGQTGFSIQKDGFPIEIKDKWSELWEDINKDNRVVEALRSVFYEYMLETLTRKKLKELSVQFHVGYIYFAEHCCYYNDDGDLFELEMPEIIAFLANSFDTLKKWSRRLGKSTTDKIAALRDCVCFPNFKIGVVERNWPTAKEWLSDEGPGQLLERNPVLIDWAGGIRENQKIKLTFKNGSGIFVCSAKTIKKYLVGKGLRRVIEDEKSKHEVPRNAMGKRIATGLTTLLQGQKMKQGSPPTIHIESSTPEGIGTDFHRDEKNKKKLRLMAPVGCPMGYKRWVCSQRIDGKACPHYSVTQLKKGESKAKDLECCAPIEYLPPDEDGIAYPDFSKFFFRLPDDRTKEGDVIEAMNNEFYELGPHLWLQEYMCKNLDYTGNAFDREMVDKWMDGTVEEAHADQIDEYGYVKYSNKPCVATLDLGLTKKHMASLVIEEMYAPGKWHIIRVVYLQDWLFEKFGIKISHTHYLQEDGDPGIFNYVLDILKGPYGDYNIQAFGGDASGPGGKDYIGTTFRRMFSERFGFDSVVAIKIQGESKQFGNKVQMARSLMVNMHNGRSKCIHHEKLRRETLAWKIDETVTGRTTAHAPEKGLVQSDDGLLAAIMANWMAFTYLISADYNPETTTMPSSYGQTERSMDRLKSDGDPLSGIFERSDKRGRNRNDWDVW